MNAATPLIRLNRASVQFQPAWRAAALLDVSLGIGAGERVALVGANGCGKSTLLRVLHGLLQPTQGERWSAPDLRQAMLFQRPHMLRTSAQNHIAIGLWLQGDSWRAARTQAILALQRVRLEHHAQQAAYTLSGGQQQRLALARAWALRPHMLLLDEPTASLDPHAKSEVEALMDEFARPGAAQSEGMTMVFASHNLGQVKRLAQRVIYLEQGRILADLPVQGFFNPQCLGAVSPAAQLFVKGERI